MNRSVLTDFSVCERQKHSCDFCAILSAGTQVYLNLMCIMAPLIKVPLGCYIIHIATSSFCVSLSTQCVPSSNWYRTHCIINRTQCIINLKWKNITNGFIVPLLTWGITWWCWQGLGGYSAILFIREVNFFSVNKRKEGIQWRNMYIHLSCLCCIFICMSLYPYSILLHEHPYYVLRLIFSNIFYPGVFTQLWMGSIYTAILHPLTRVITGSAQLSISAPSPHLNTQWSLHWQDSEFCFGENLLHDDIFELFVGWCDVMCPLAQCSPLLHCK